MSSRPSVFSDFDETMIPYNSGRSLVKYYLLHGEKDFFYRTFRLLPLLSRRIRLKQWKTFYDVLRKIPHKKRIEIMSNIPMNENWLREITKIRQRFRLKNLKFTIISGNCIDVIHDWVQAHMHELKMNHLTVDTIICNGPINEETAVTVKEHYKHIEYASLGRILSEDKAEFIDKHTIYLGDGPDSVLKGKVKEFIRI